MGKTGSKLAKPLKNWNIENRAHKIISRDKPKPAPLYEATHRQIELVNKLEPDYVEKAQKKDQQLDDHLKQVFVNSNNAEIKGIDQRSNPDRPLPKDKLLHEGFAMGVYEPTEITPGRISLRQTLEMLSNHKKEPEKYTAEYLADQYKLEKEVVENILTYYSLFNVYDIQKDHNQDVVASSIPISLTTGVHVRWTPDTGESEVTKLRRSYRTEDPNNLPVEDDKKKISS